MRAYIPTPSFSYIALGPFKVHFYALFILIGIVVSLKVAQKRAPEKSELISELVLVAVPAGIVGARIFHVATTPEKYFNKNFIDIFKVWEGGLGIWGAIAGGAIATFFALKKRGLSAQFLPIADALAPGLLLAQAIGRLGNWFNGELFGKPSSLPWALNIPIEKRPIEFINFETFHPTFLYEAIWCLLLALVLMRIKPNKPGQILWSYVTLYSIGRIFIETLRIDYSHIILGVRLNILTSIFFVLIGAWQYLKIKRSEVG